LSIQLLHGFTFAFYWSAVVDAIYKLSSKDMQSSCMASLNLIFYTVGGAIGNVVFGNIYDYYGGVYFVYIVSCFIGIINVKYFERFEQSITSTLDIYKTESI
jgi:PPP family 3-phenylpropionic acid transporter